MNQTITNIYTTLLHSKSIRQKWKQLKPALLAFAGCLLIVLASLPLSAQTFIHPGILHKESDFDRMRAKVQANAQPWKAGWDVLTANSHAQLSYTPNPVETIYRGGGSPQNFQLIFNDAAAAYQCALRWKISNNSAYADKAVQILNAWANTLKVITGSTDASLVVGLQGFQFANAAEIMRSYNGWSPTDFAKFKKFMIEMFYYPASGFLYRRNGTCITHYWANWGLCNASAVMAIGILCDDYGMYNEGMNYMKSGSGTEAINNVVYYLHSPTLGQWQESNRDQGHTLLGGGLASDICEMAWNQGDDLYAFSNNRLLAGFEYMAKYNLGEEVPNVPYNNCDNVNQTTIGSVGRGGARPTWEKIYNHYVNRKGIAVPLSKQFAGVVRPEGGGGDYGSTSGGYDLLGFGTLTYTLDSLTTTCLPTAITPNMQVNGGSLQQIANIKVDKNATIVLSPQAIGGGSWSWSNGAGSRELTLSNMQQSGIYRATFTNGCGTQSVQSFCIAVAGDCSDVKITPYMFVSGGWRLADTAKVDSGATVKLGPQGFGGGISNAGTWSWSNGATTQEITLTNIQSAITVIGTYTSPCGKAVSDTFKITLRNYHEELQAKLAEAKNLRDTTQTSTTSVAGKFPVAAKAQLSDSITYVETVYNSATSTVSQIRGYITLLNNAIVKYKQSMYVDLNKLANGLYYIKIPNVDSFWTVNQTNIPKFGEAVDDKSLQLFSISKQPNGRYKLTSVASAPAGYFNYINEQAQFGKNVYDATWNTMNIFFNGSAYAVQKAEKSGNGYWFLSADKIAVQSGTTNSNVPLAFPFELKPDLYYVLDQKLAFAIKLKDTTIATADTTWGQFPVSAKNRLSDSISYVQSVYNAIATTEESLRLVGLLDREIVKYRQSMYVQMNGLADGIYFIKTPNADSLWTRNTTNSPSFEAQNADKNLQRWRITKESNGRYKITCLTVPVSPYKNFINESAQFSTNDYLVVWNTMNVYYNGITYAVQRAQSAGNGYWFINGNKVQAVSGTISDPFPYSFPFNLAPAPDTQTITFAPLSPKIMGDSAFILNATASSGLPVSFSSSDTNVAKIVGGKVQIASAGVATITASQPGNGFFAATAGSQTLTVNKLYYVDADRDGFGSTDTAWLAAKQTPEGYATNNTDCDDTKLLYTDNDGDGLGAGTPAACGVANNTDCDDTNPVQLAVNIPDIYAMNAAIDTKNTIYVGYGPAVLPVSAAVTGGTAPYSYQWSTGEVTQSINVTAAGTYTVAGTDSKGCTATDTIVMNVLDVRCGNNNDKVKICHNNKEICVASAAVQEHLDHGDRLGGCVIITARTAVEREDASGYNVVMHPNPAMEVLNIRVSQLKTGAIVQLYNAAGVLVKSLRLIHLAQPVSLKGLAAGLYFVQIRNGSHFTMTKVIKE